MLNSSVPSAQPAIELIDDQPNLLMGLIGGFGAMLVGAIVWGAISYFTKYQIGWMAIGVGFLVGIAIKFFGKGKSAIFGASGAVLALIGCVLGNLIFYSAVRASIANTSFLQEFLSFLLNPAAVIDTFMVAFDVKDILYYALAAYFGFSTAMDIKRTRK
jgi:hypothetical protein